MPSLSAFVRRFLCLTFLALLSCASSKPGPPAREIPVTLEGEATLAGSGPLDDRIVLADAGGSFCTLRSATLEYELRSLAGHRVRVTGRLMGKTSGIPEFLVESYSLAPMNGHQPIIGVLESRSGKVVLVEPSSGGAYVLDGSLATVLCNFIGYKVWIIGPEVPAAEKGGEAAGLTIEGYGVLVPAAGSTSREP
jgi:hypothetical protein